MSSRGEITTKQRIARQFSRAAYQYDQAADVQARIARDALALVTDPYKRGLDIGCGTGRVSRQLQTFAESVIGLDLAHGMVKTAAAQQKSAHWLQGDAESLPVVSESMDLVFSSMALQWCQPLTQAFSEVHRVLAAEGKAVITLMVDGSFHELNRCWRCLDENHHTNRFLTAESVIQTASGQGFDVTAYQQDYTTYHPSVRRLIGSIKAIGANVVIDRRSGYLGRDTLKQLEEHYVALYGDTQGLPLTYRILTLELCK